MKKFNPITATPDDIAEFVKSLSDEELRNSLIHSFLQMKKINTAWEKITDENSKMIDAIIKAVDDGKIVLKNEI